MTPCSMNQDGHSVLMPTPGNWRGDLCRDSGHRPPPSLPLLAFADEASDIPVERQKFQINRAQRCVLGKRTRSLISPGRALYESCARLFSFGTGAMIVRRVANPYQSSESVSVVDSASRLATVIALIIEGFRFHSAREEAKCRTH